MCQKCFLKLSVSNIDILYYVYTCREGVQIGGNYFSGAVILAKKKKVGQGDSGSSIKESYDVFNESFVNSGF